MTRKNSFANRFFDTCNSEVVKTGISAKYACINDGNLNHHRRYAVAATFIWGAEAPAELDSAQRS